MRSVVMYAPGDVRVEDRPEPGLGAPADAVIRLAATCICGSDLWPYRGWPAAPSSPPPACWRPPTCWAPAGSVTLPLEKAAEGYRAMDERQATKVLSRP